ncbi:hypothetical protein [Spirosoma litoris]
MNSFMKRALGFYRIRCGKSAFRKQYSDKLDKEGVGVFGGAEHDQDADCHIWDNHF